MESDSEFEQSYQSDDFHVSNLEIIDEKNSEDIQNWTRP